MGGVFGGGHWLTQPLGCSVEIQMDGVVAGGAAAVAGCHSDGADHDEGTVLHGSSPPGGATGAAAHPMPAKMPWSLAKWYQAAEREVEGFAKWEVLSWAKLEST